TVSTTAALNVACCRGVSGMACRSWPIRRWAAPEPACCVIPRLHVLAYARLFGSRRCAGLDHPQWSRDCNSRIWFCRACKGERRRADTDADATGTSNTGCSPSAAEPLTEGIDLNQNALWTEQRPDGAAGLGGSALEMTSPATRFSARSSRGRVHSATVLG